MDRSGKKSEPLIVGLIDQFGSGFCAFSSKEDIILVKRSCLLIFLLIVPLYLFLI